MAPVSLHPLFKDGSRGGLTSLVVDQHLIDRLSASFESLRPAADDFAAAFYRRLFLKKPELKAMFQSPMDIQRRKLIASLETIVQFLADPASQRAYLRELGRRHAGYGARPEHYDLVVDTLMEAMDEVTGGLIDPVVRKEWRDVLHLVSEWMIDGASSIQSPASERPTL